MAKIFQSGGCVLRHFCYCVLDRNLKISMFVAYDSVPDLARSSRTFLKTREKWTLNVVHVLYGASLRRHYLHSRGYNPTLKTKV